MAGLFGGRSVVNYLFLRLREAAADGEKAGGSEAPPWDRAVQLQVLCQTFLMLGRMEEGTRILDELESQATKVGQSYSIARCSITRAWVEFGKAADLAKLQTALHQALKSNLKVSFVDWDVFSQRELSLVDYFCGNWESALFHAQESFRLEVGSSILGSGVGTLFRQMAYAGDRAGALAILDQKRGRLPSSGRPNTGGSWSMLALVIEGLVILGEHSQAAQLYPLARELVDTGAVALWQIFRFTHTVAGMAAAAAHEWEAAEDHFQTALQQAESFPHHLEQAEIRRFHAMMLMDRAAPGDRERARRLIHQAWETYEHIGMRAHCEISQTLLD
jgi:tetratricopeptide (TPR) repeat protein